MGREPHPPDIGEVGAPLQVSGDGLETDKEAGEQEDRDGSHWAHKGGHLKERGMEPGCHRGDHGSIHPMVARDVSHETPHLGANFPTCKEVEAAPIKRPKDWATKAVAMAKAEKSRKRLVSAGWPVIQYTMLQYTTGHTTWGAATESVRDPQVQGR